LGQQGKPLARNLVDGGYTVAVYDRFTEPMAELVPHGAIAAVSPRDAAQKSSVVAICVVDDAQLEAVMAGPDGVLAGLAEGAIVAVHSTVSPRTIETLSARVHARGGELVDAPVSGGERGAVGRTMSYMVGGSARAFDICKPLFETSGSKITHCGPAGMGMRAKLVHQIIIAGNRLAAFEGMRLGLEAGLSKEILQKVIHEGGAQSRVADDWFTRTSGGHARPLYNKDLTLGIEFAAGLGIELPGAILAKQHLNEIVS
jgi:3-hydroxyisobutyrate dehydrogenase-like beta-hydroxyacid dehydrogenase